MSATPRTQQYRDGLQRADIDYHEMYESMVHFSETLENELGENEYAVDPSFARELETELAAMTARAEKAETELARAHDIIKRASVQFFHDGTDGDAAAKMLTVLNEAAMKEASK